MKKAIVVGASSGIGRELSKQLTEKGYKVGIAGRRKNLLDEVKLENPDSFSVRSFDITDVNTSVIELEALVREIGGLDLLVISSGFRDLAEAVDFELQKVTIETNVIGFSKIVDWTFGYFSKQGSGHLAVISSVGGLRGSRQAPSYHASKAYQINYLEGMRQKARKLNLPITITDIRPGIVDTEKATGEVLFWVMPVEKVAMQIFKAILKKKKVVYVTKRWGVVAAILRLLPERIYNKM